MFFYADDALIQLADSFACLYHTQQTRRSGHETTYDHVKRVAAGATRFGCSSAAIAAAYLHDIVEDTDVTLDTLRIVGFPERTIMLVDLLTRKEGQSYSEYIDTLLQSNDREAMLVKLADLNDNSNINPNALWDGWRNALERYTASKLKIVNHLQSLGS